MLPISETAVISASAEDSAELFNYSKNIKRISDEEPAESISISGVKDTSVTEIAIPAEIEGLPVTRISSHAFSRCSNLASVTIPESVTSIDKAAFSGTPWLKAKQEENPLVVVNGILIDDSGYCKKYQQRSFRGFCCDFRHTSGQYDRCQRFNIFWFCTCFCESL